MSEAGVYGKSLPQTILAGIGHSVVRRRSWCTSGSSCNALACSAGVSCSANHSLPSMENFGVARSIQFGSHQPEDPSRDMIAGTSTQRTTVASTATATAMPRPNCLSVGSPFITKARKTETMIIAAEVITRAVEARPCTTASWESFVTFHCSRTWVIRKTDRSGEDQQHDEPYYQGRPGMRAHVNGPASPTVGPLVVVLAHAKHAQAVDRRPDQAEYRGQQGGRRRGCDDHHDRRCVAQGRHERYPGCGEGEQRDDHRPCGKDYCAPGGSGGPGDRLARLHAFRELAAVAGNYEQGVIDTNTQPDHRRQGWR